MFRNMLSVDQAKCSLCQVCVLTCPNKALELVEADVGAQLVLNYRLCKHPCQVCEDKCPSQAIKIQKKISLPFFFPKQDRWFVKFVECRECGDYMEPVADNEKSVCPKCRREKASLRQLKNHSSFYSRGHIKQDSKS